MRNSKENLLPWLSALVKILCKLNKRITKIGNPLVFLSVVIVLFVIVLIVVVSVLIVLIVLVVHLNSPRFLSV